MDLEKIIEATSKSPTIVNPDSKYVVITYWWGRNVKNRNIARPCIGFFETIINAALKFAIGSYYLEEKRVNISQDFMRQDKQMYGILFEQIVQYYYENYDNMITYHSKIYKQYLKNDFKGEDETELMKRIESNKKDITEKMNKINNLKKQYVNKINSRTNTPQNSQTKRKTPTPTNNQTRSRRSPKSASASPKSASASASASPKAAAADLNIPSFSPKDTSAFLHLSMDKQTAISYSYMNLEEIKTSMDFIISNMFFLLAEDIEKLALKKLDIDRTQNIKEKNIYVSAYNDIYANMKKKINTKNPTYPLWGKFIQKSTEYTDIPEYQNLSIFELFVKIFGYFEPINYEEMIDKWENECKNSKCNYLSVEYPEFTRPGGYQLAINAKPLFIKKCLELCEGRGVLYIDGDMYIRKYPKIFDMPDVDFMARGWNIDPRASDRIVESITVDPYTFETSGGTMFFSQSFESKRLLELWIEQTAKPINSGKADDRILSLIINTRNLLLNMKIIQLPIEYLWLTLYYDEYLIDYEYYDWDYTLMTNSIFIEHPECLTSEETASGKGAASNRLPKHYGFIDKYITPISEQFFEYAFFPNKEMTDAYKDYVNVLNILSYTDDGNPKLEYNRGDDSYSLIDERPFYVTKYDNKMGKYNSICDKIMRDSKKIQYSITQEDPYEIIIDYDPALIINLMSRGKKVIYYPIPKNLEQKLTNTDKEIIRNFYALSSSPMYSNMEFIFTPVFSFVNNPQNTADYFRVGINSSKPILFSGNNPILTILISMFYDLEDLSYFMFHGCYYFISRIRIGYFETKQLKRIYGHGGSRKSILRSVRSAISKKSPIKTRKSIPRTFENKYIENMKDFYRQNMR